MVHYYIRPYCACFYDREEIALDGGFDEFLARFDGLVQWFDGEFDFLIDDEVMALMEKHDAKWCTEQAA